MTNRQLKSGKTHHNRLRHACYWLALVFALSQVVLILLSWLLTAAMPEMAYRSLLSPGGLRWFFGNFTFKLASPWLVYILVVSIAIGTVNGSGLWRAITRIWKRDINLTPQQHYALRAAILLGLLEFAVMLSLVLFPHAVLLSITGEIFPSSFSVSLIPSLAFICISSAILYGLLSGRLHGLYEVGECLSSAKEWIMPILLVYMVGYMLWHMIAYVFIIG